MHVQRQRLRESICRVDPSGVRARIKAITYNLSTCNHTAIPDHELGELVQELYSVFPKCGENFVVEDFMLEECMFKGSYSGNQYAESIPQGSSLNQKSPLQDIPS